MEICRYCKRSGYLLTNAIFFVARKYRYRRRGMASYVLEDLIENFQISSLYVKQLCDMCMTNSTCKNITGSRYHHHGL